MPYFLYILQSIKDETYYVGSTQDLNYRVERHNQGRVTYTKPKRPWKLVYSEEHPNRSSASKREYAIKLCKSKDYIANLVEEFRSG